MAYGRKATWAPVYTLTSNLIVGPPGTYTLITQEGSDPSLGFTNVDARMVFFTNSTNTDLYISLDAVNNHLRLAAGSSRSVCMTENSVGDQAFLLPQGTTFYVAQTEQGNPTLGSIAIELIYATIPI